MKVHSCYRVFLSFVLSSIAHSCCSSYWQWGQKPESDILEVGQDAPVAPVQPSNNFSLKAPKLVEELNSQFRHSQGQNLTNKLSKGSSAGQIPLVTVA